MNSVSKKNMKQYLAGPYLIWMTGFTIIPLLLIAWYGLTDAGGAFWKISPPSLHRSTPRPCFYLWGSRC